jgi:hypothetical protein
MLCQLKKILKDYAFYFHNFLQKHFYAPIGDPARHTEAPALPTELQFSIDIDI